VFARTLSVMAAVEVKGVEFKEPAAGLTANHAPPLCWITDVVNVGLCAAGPVNVRVIGAGSEPPCNSVKLCAPVGEIVTALDDVMVSEIGMFRVSFVPLKRPVDVMRIEPL
jgi:hypothetical protein